MFADHVPASRQSDEFITEKVSACCSNMIREIILVDWKSAT